MTICLTSGILQPAGGNDKDKPKAAQGGVGIAEIVWKEENTVLGNHDFEYGDLTGWEIISGSAFSVSYSQKNMNNVYFNQNGIFYLSSNPAQKGEIRSQSFVIDTNEINFMVSGASDENNLFIALVSSANNEVLFKETGNDSVVFSRRIWNVSDYIGTECYIKIVDNSFSSSFNIDDININIIKPDDTNTDETRKP
jgi:fructan beta-fructosidase